MFFCFYEEDSGLSDKGKQGKRPEENTKKDLIVLFYWKI